MSGYAGGRMVGSLPGGTTSRAVLAPSAFRMLRNAGYPVSRELGVIDPMSGSGSLALYASLLGYNVTAGDALPNARACVRLALGLSEPPPGHLLATLGRAHPDATPEPDDAFFMPQHAAALAWIRELEVMHPLYRDFLLTLRWRMVAGLLPGSAFGIRAVNLIRRLRSGDFDDLPATVDTQARRQLAAAQPQVQRSAAALATAFLPTAGRHTVSETPEAAQTLQDAHSGIVILDPVQPFTPRAVIEAQRKMAQHLCPTEDHSTLNPDGGTPVDALGTLDALIQASAKHPAVLTILDTQKGKVSAAPLLDMLQAHRPGQKVRQETYRRAGQDTLSSHLMVLCHE